MVKRLIKGVGIGALALLACLTALWGAGMIWFNAPVGWRWPLMVGWGLLVTAAGMSRRLRGGRRVRIVATVAVLGLFGWFHAMSPSHDRAWADDVGRLLEAQVDGDRLQLRNVRNFDWRNDGDYTVHWEDRTYDLDELVSGDLVLSYWMGPAIAHTLVSFGFADGRHLVFSLEIRKERHESFSALAGLFRQYEAVLVAADENDIVRVRANARGEDVHLYRLSLPSAELRTMLLGYVREAEQIRTRPRFYHTLTSNCTSIVFDLARKIEPGLPFDYRLLLSGYLARYVQERGGLAEGHDYAELEQKGDITARSRAFTGPPGDYSAWIRTGVPGGDVYLKHDHP
nr:DUF4105 domain-containing protein [Pseudoxanthomonas jiangsuensis]